MLTDSQVLALVPDPFPLRVISVPPEVSAVDGCDCGGLDWHRAADWQVPGCSIWSLPPGQAQAAVDDARRRIALFTGELTHRANRGSPQC